MAEQVEVSDLRARATRLGGRDRHTARDCYSEYDYLWLHRSAVYVHSGHSK